MFDLTLLQFFGEGDSLIQIIWFAFFILFIFFGPRLMVTQTIWKLEKDVADLETLASKSQDIVAKKVSSNPTKELRKKISGFMEFFAVSPVNIDPYGVMKKIDLLGRQADKRFAYFASRIAPGFSAEEQSNVKNALAGAITTHQIAKIVRHMLETIKKYKIFQMAIILQMQIPLISSIAKSAASATKAFADGVPIGDGVGPLVVARMIPAKSKVNVSKEDEFSMSRIKLAGRNIWVTKASGPGATTGYPGRFLSKLFRKNKFNRIITIDAALRMEGEKTGSVAEGIGIAMGGSGVDRYEIENIAVQKNIPLDAVAIKVSQEEALEPMKKEVYESVPEAIETVKNILLRIPRKEKILIIGVGNTCGVPNSLKGIEKTENKVKESIKKWEAENKKKKKGFFGYAA